MAISWTIHNENVAPKRLICGFSADSLSTPGPARPYLSESDSWTLPYKNVKSERFQGLAGRSGAEFTVKTPIAVFLEMGYSVDQQSVTPGEIREDTCLFFTLLAFEAKEHVRYSTRN